MPLRTFDPMQSVDVYNKAQDRQRSQGLQDYKQERQVETDRRGNEAYQRTEEARPGLQAIASRDQSLADDTVLKDLGQQQLTALNPDSPTFKKDVEQSVVDFTNAMHERGYSPELIRGHANKMLTSGTMSPDNIRLMREKAGLSRPQTAGEGALDAVKLEREKLKLKGEQKAAGQKGADADESNQAAIATMDNSIGTIDRLLAEDSGLESAAGMQANFPTLAGSDAANFEAVLETLQSQNFLAQVKQMKGMGALSENEGKKLGASIGSLSLDMGDEKLRTELKRIRKVFSKAKDKMAGIKESAPDKKPNKRIAARDKKTQQLKSKYGLE